MFVPRSARLALVLVAGALCCLTGPARAGYHLLKRVTLGGEGGWDLLAVDPAAHRLYITHSTRVEVLDADSCSVVGAISGLRGAHGVAVASELGRGFITAGGDTAVVIFDLKTLKTIGRVPTGLRPDAIVYDKASGRVFAMNAGSRSATVIDAAKGTVVGTVELGGQPELTVVDGAGRLYVNLEDSSAVEMVDTRAMKSLARWPLAPGEGPTGLALDTAHQRLFAACDDTLMVVMDATSGKIVTTLPIGAGPDGADYDPAMNRAFSSNGSGSLSVVEEVTPDNFRVTENVPTDKGARTLVVDPQTHRVFLVTAQYGPPPPATAEQPHPRRTIVPGSFVLLVYGP